MSFLGGNFPDTWTAGDVMTLLEKKLWEDVNNPSVENGNGQGSVESGVVDNQRDEDSDGVARDARSRIEADDDHHSDESSAMTSKLYSKLYS